MVIRHISTTIKVAFYEAITNTNYLAIFKFLPYLFLHFTFPFGTMYVVVCKFLFNIEIIY